MRRHRGHFSRSPRVDATFKGTWDSVNGKATFANGYQQPCYSTHLVWQKGVTLYLIMDQFTLLPQPGIYYVAHRALTMCHRPT